MNREEKHQLVAELKETIGSYGNFYITDTSNLDVAKINDIRRKCFELGIGMQVVKNTFIQKALEAQEGDYQELYQVLKGASTLLFSQTGNAPARLIEELRRKGDKPVLKAACIDSTIFIGDDQLTTLVNLKSKEELVGDIIALLQSPAKRVISGLQSGSNKLAGIIKTLQEKES